MKKITVLITLLLTSSIGFSQLVSNSTFTADTAGWVVNGAGSTVTWSGTEGSAAAGAMVLTAAAAAARAQSSPNTIPTLPGDYLVTAKVKGTAGSTIQPVVFQTANIKSGLVQPLTGGWDTVSFLATGLNNTVAANLRLVAGGAGIFYIDDVYFTYQVPPGSTLTTAVVGSGTVTKSPDQLSYPTATAVTLTATPTTHWLFNNWTGDLTGNTNPGIVNLDGTANKAVTANFVIDPAFNYDFKFNTDGNLEGWTLDPQMVLTSHTGGLVTVTPSADQFARLNLLNFPIPSATYNKLTIKLQNNSATTDQVAVVAGVITSNVTTLTTSDTGQMTYVFNLTQNTGWTGDVASMKLRFADADNPNAGKPSDTGSIIIDDITFSYDASYLGLSSKKINSKIISVYPSPARDILNIKSPEELSSVELYDMNGKYIGKNKNIINNQIDVSNLKSGVYMLKVITVNNTIEDKKIIISN